MIMDKRKVAWVGVQPLLEWHEIAHVVSHDSARRASFISVIIKSATPCFIVTQCSYGCTGWNLCLAKVSLCNPQPILATISNLLDA